MYWSNKRLKPIGLVVRVPCSSYQPFFSLTSSDSSGHRHSTWPQISRCCLQAISRVVSFLLTKHGCLVDKRYKIHNSTSSGLRPINQPMLKGDKSAELNQKIPGWNKTIREIWVCFAWSHFLAWKNDDERIIHSYLFLSVDVMFLHWTFTVFFRATVLVWSSAGSCDMPRDEWHWLVFCLTATRNSCEEVPLHQRLHSPPLKRLSVNEMFFSNGLVSLNLKHHFLRQKYEVLWSLPKFGEWSGTTCTECTIMLPNKTAQEPFNAPCLKRILSE